MRAQAKSDAEVESFASGDLRARPVAVNFANLELRPDEYQALADGRRVGLTVREFQVLHVLAEQEDRVVRRAEVYRHVWGGEMKHRERAVDVFVRKVRHKLTAAAPSWSYIHTHFGIGYRFTPESLQQTEREWNAQTSTPQTAHAPQIAQHADAVILRG